MRTAARPVGRTFKTTTSIGIQGAPKERAPHYSGYGVWPNPTEYGQILTIFGQIWLILQLEAHSYYSGYSGCGVWPSPTEYGQILPTFGRILANCRGFRGDVAPWPHGQYNGPRKLEYFPEFGRNWSSSGCMPSGARRRHTGNPRILGMGRQAGILARIWPKVARIWPHSLGVDQTSRPE